MIRRKTSRRRRSTCKYGVKKSGGCKKKSGPKKGSVKRMSSRPSRRRSRRMLSNSRCKYGVKKSGGCKNKPGPKKGSRSRRKSRRMSRRRSRRMSSKSRGKVCKYGVKKSGGCKKKPGAKKGSRRGSKLRSRSRFAFDNFEIDDPCVSYDVYKRKADNQLKADYNNYELQKRKHANFLKQLKVYLNKSETKQFCKGQKFKQQEKVSAAKEAIKVRKENTKNVKKEISQSARYAELMKKAQSGTIGFFEKRELKKLQKNVQKKGIQRMQVWELKGKNCSAVNLTGSEIEEGKKSGNRYFRTQGSCYSQLPKVNVATKQSDPCSKTSKNKQKYDKMDEKNKQKYDTKYRCK